MVFTPSVVDSVQFGHAVDLDFGIDLVLVTPRGRAPGVSPKKPVKVKSECFVNCKKTTLDEELTYIYIYMNGILHSTSSFSFIIVASHCSSPTLGDFCPCPPWITHKLGDMEIRRGTDR